MADEKKRPEDETKEEQDKRHSEERTARETKEKRR
jgi:hypothetical protein